MERAFSFPSSGIGYFIGHQIVNNQQIAILSPWISDIKIRYPHNDEGYDDELLSKAIREGREVRILAADEEHNEYLFSRIPDDSYEIIEDLHAKAVISEDLVLIGSANVTRGGLYENIEICKIMENLYDSIEIFIEEEL